jgi:hypothetical protein
VKRPMPSITTGLPLNRSILEVKLDSDHGSARLLRRQYHIRKIGKAA